MRALIAFASLHGSTEEIASEIARVVREDGFTVDVRGAGSVSGVGGYCAVVLGSAIYRGSWLPTALDFATRHADALRPIPVWIFSSGPLGPVTDDLLDQPGQLGELETLVLPEEHRVFSGSMDLETLDFGERMMMRAAGQTSGDHRDWGEVRAWARGIAAALHLERM